MGPNKSTNRGIRIIQGREVQIVELGWASGHKAFEVILLGEEGEDLLTEGEFLLEMPTNGKLAQMISKHTARKASLN